MDNSIVDPEEDPRPRMKILRLLIAGGLMTPERDHRHRRKQGKVLCSCGEAEPDVIHISWHCKNYQQLRSKALAVTQAFEATSRMFPIRNNSSC